MHASTDAEGRHLRLQRRTPLSVAEDRQVDAGQLGHRIEEQPVVLDRGQPGRHSDERLIRTDPERRPELPCGSGHVEVRLQVDARRQHLVLGRPSDPEVEQGVPDLGAHRDEPVGAPGQAPFDLGEERLGPRGEVAAEDVAVEGVHHARPVRHRRRRHAGHGACLCGVAVHQADPVAAQQAPHGDRGRTVLARVDGTHHR